MKNLKIDPERLWDDLMETARIGATPKGGICRLTLTELDRQVRDWFKARMLALGCAVTVDDMGAMFARRDGQHADIAPIAMGSHLDTQPTGGKFDGALGVLAALEALQASEYGFWANVNPQVDHPRWSQASEEVIGTGEHRPTLLFNGYGEYVAELYKGLENERLWA